MKEFELHIISITKLFQNVTERSNESYYVL